MWGLESTGLGKLGQGFSRPADRAQRERKLEMHFGVVVIHGQGPAILLDRLGITTHFCIRKAQIGMCLTIFIIEGNRPQKMLQRLAYLALLCERETPIGLGFRVSRIERGRSRVGLDRQLQVSAVSVRVSELVVADG